MSNNRSNEITSKSDTQNSLFYLPTETKLHIMSFLNRKELAVASQVCSEWNVLAQDRSLPALQAPDYQHASEPTVMADKILDITSSDDGRYLAILSSEPQENFTLVDTETNTIQLKITIDRPRHSDNIQLALTPDLMRLIVTHVKLKHDHNIHEVGKSYIDIWDLKNKEYINGYENINAHAQVLPFSIVKVISNERFLVSLTPYWNWYLHDIEFKNIYLCEVNKKSTQLVYSDDKYESNVFRASCLSPDKKLFARVLNNNVNIHDTETGKKINTILLPIYDLNHNTDIHFLNDNKTLCLVSCERSESNVGHVFYRKNPLHPFVLKIDCINGNTSKLEFCKNRPDEYSDHSALLPNNHLAVFGQKDNMTTKISILDLNAGKQVKDIFIAAKKIVTNNNGTRMFILTEDRQLNKINVPLIHDLKLQQQEQNEQTDKLRMR